VITVATWNVLHRVHAQNWVEDAVRRQPDESARIAAITARLAARTERAIALQEVSGDQLTALRDALPGRTVHTLRYPRIPKPRRGPVPLHDLTEYLVLLVDGPSQPVTAESFPDDPGKGALVIRIDGTLVIATHVSGDRRRTRQLTRLAELATEPAVLLGDFNTDRATVAAALGPGFVVADLPPDALPTRPGTSRWIDHVIVRGAIASDAAVEDVAGLSDHNLVRATVTA
jgi:endonuclease/exonuclease/phosphatase family metal-dependent hydrolase